jgi:hypothetical protein
MVGMKMLERACNDSTNFRERRIHSRMGWNTYIKNGYVYKQRSYRVGGKVKTESIYLGPVNRKRKKGGGFPAVNPMNVVVGVFGLAVQLAKHGTRVPHYRVKNRLPDPRSLKHLREAARASAHKQRDELTDRERIARDAWAREMSLMPREEWERQKAQIRAEQRAEREQAASAPKTQEQLLKDRLTEAYNARYSKQNEQEQAKEPPPMDDAPSPEPDAASVEPDAPSAPDASSGQESSS